MPDTTSERTSLAAEQLDVAIEMFLASRSDVSALTLAGAAEEVLGQAVKLRGGENVLQEWFQVTSRPHRLLTGKTLK